MNSPAPHADPETLLRLADQDLPPAETSAVRTHLDGCGDCQLRLEAVRDALAGYDRFHREVLKPALPSAPAEWKLEFPKTRPMRFRPVPWLAAAAAIAAVVFLVRRFEDTPEVRAAELLRKAAAAEAAAETVAPPQGRIRILSRSRRLDRAARLPAPSRASETADAAALHAMFDAAGYSWDDPLSVIAFSSWRNRLPEKHDQVEQTARAFLLRTSTPAGALESAALTLRATDLHAVNCKLYFRSGGETIEISELAAETPAVPLPPEPSPPVPAPPPVKNATARDELRVTVALHAIGADLGEPVDVSRSGAAILVQVSGLDSRRREEIRRALAEIPTAQLRFDDLPPAASRNSLPPERAPQPADRVNPLVAELRSHLANDQPLSGLADQLIDATDRATERAFALRALARRFPPDVSAQLSPADSATLNRIALDHARAFATALRELRAQLTAILPESAAPKPTAGAPSWQALAEALPAAVERLDRTLNGATDASDARKAEVSQSLASLQAQISALENVVAR